MLIRCDLRANCVLIILFRRQMARGLLPSSPSRKMTSREAAAREQGSGTSGYRAANQESARYRAANQDSPKHGKATNQDLPGFTRIPSPYPSAKVINRYKVHHKVSSMSVIQDMYGSSSLPQLPSQLLQLPPYNYLYNHSISPVVATTSRRTSNTTILP